MNTPRCLKIATRIDAWLLHELGQGISPQRMVEDARYARDVLLVCDAHPGSTLAALAQHFRDAELQDLDPPRSGFSASRFLSSFFWPCATTGFGIGLAAAVAHPSRGTGPQGKLKLCAEFPR
jgi:hypothetical protein